MAMAQFSVDFRNATGFGVTAADQFQIDGIRVDLTATHPLTGEPMIISVDGNIRWQFEYDSLKLRIIGAQDANNTGCSIPTFTVMVTDALTGLPIAGATVNAAGNSVTTGPDGAAVFSGLTTASVLVRVMANNYGSVEQSVELACGEPGATGISLVSTSDIGTQRGDIRLVLTWGEEPRDLDSHLTRYQAGSATADFHVYYGARNNCTGAPCDPTIPAWLDVDDVTSFGPETITILAGANGAFEPGTYRYSVHHYSGLNNIPTSGATVQLYLGQTLLRTYSAPGDIGGVGDDWVWTVVEIAVFSDGQISLNEVGTYYGPTGAGSVLSSPASLLGIPVKNENPALFENLPAK